MPFPTGSTPEQALADAPVRQVGSVTAGHMATWVADRQIEDGGAAAGIDWRGTWNGATPYAVNDVVHHGGAAWIANTNNTNEEPGVSYDWDLFVSQGSGANPDLTYLTADDETAELANSRRVLAGAGIEFNDSTPGERTITAKGDILDTIYVRKTADESVTSSVALQADDHLLFAIGANETWEFEMVINHLGNETGDIKFSVEGPTGCAGQWSTYAPFSGTASGSRDYAGLAVTTWNLSETVAAGNISTARTCSLIKGLIRNGANAGNVTLYWAQNTSNGTATQVLTDSYLIARRVG